MTDSIDIDDIETERTDYRRANGAPMIINKEGKNERRSRPSGWGKDLDDENALVNWKLNRAIEGVAKDKALQARGASLDPDSKEDKEHWKNLREAAINAGRGAQSADIGTALHKMTERWEQEPDFDPGEPYTQHLETYEKELKRLDLISQRFEVQMVTDEYMTAGTADRVWELGSDLPLPTGETLPAGTLVIGDLKTGKTLDFSLPAYSVQMSIYAQGEYYDVTDDRYLPTPDINQDWGILAWLPSDDPTVCHFQWVDLRVGNYGAWLTREVREWRKNWKRKDGYASPRIGDPVDGTTAVVEAKLEEALGAETLQLDDLLGYAKQRLFAIGEHPEARRKCKLFWPDAVPAPSKCETIPGALDILDHLDNVEAEFGLTFVPGDPRAPERPARAEGSVIPSTSS